MRKLSFLVLAIPGLYSISCRAQIVDPAYHCPDKMGWKIVDSLSSIVYGREGAKMAKSELRSARKLYDSLSRLSHTTWYFDATFGRDTGCFDAWKEKLGKEGKSYYYNPPNLLYTPPQLAKSRIASVSPDDRMTFYYFTWYTIHSNPAASASHGHNTLGYQNEVEADKNGDLPDGLWKWCMDKGYKRVYMVRKLVLKRTACYWLIHAYKDQFFAPVDSLLQPQADSFELMMKDGKERFKFEYEATYAQCMTSDDLVEWNYPEDFTRRKAVYPTGQFYLQNTIWEYAKIELENKQAKNVRLHSNWYHGYNRKYLTNNFIVKFSDGTHKSYHLPFWFYIHKYYIRQWKPEQ